MALWVRKSRFPPSPGRQGFFGVEADLLKKPAAASEFGTATALLTHRTCSTQLVRVSPASRAKSKRATCCTVNLRFRRQGMATDARNGKNSFSRLEGRAWQCSSQAGPFFVTSARGGARLLRFDRRRHLLVAPTEQSLYSALYFLWFGDREPARLEIVRSFQRRLAWCCESK